MILLPARKAAAMLGVTTRTLARWEEAGRLVPDFRVGTQRRWSVDLIEAFLDPAGIASKKTRAAIYARVSSAKQKADGNLARQHDRLIAHATGARWPVVMAVDEVASGVNENRRGIDRLLKAAQRSEFDVLVIEYRDRLARFGYRYLQAAFEAHGVRVEVVDEPAKSLEPTQEFVDDLLAIVMVFSARVYGARSSRMRAKVKAALLDRDAL